MEKPSNKADVNLDFYAGYNTPIKNKPGSVLGGALSVNLGIAVELISLSFIQLELGLTESYTSHEKAQAATYENELMLFHSMLNVNGVCSLPDAPEFLLKLSLSGGIVYVRLESELHPEIYTDWLTSFGVSGRFSYTFPKPINLFLQISYLTVPIDPEPSMWLSELRIESGFGIRL